MKTKSKRNAVSRTSKAAARPTAVASPAGPVLDVAAMMMRPSELHAWADNPRANDGEPVRRVAASIKRFGFGSPLLVRAENLEIIAGHTRWKAALSLELERVPVRLLDVSEADAHLLALADNRLGELAQWNVSLVDLLSALQLDDMLLAGFAQVDVDRLTAELLSAAKQLPDDEAPRLDRPGEAKEITCPDCNYTWRPAK